MGSLQMGVRVQIPNLREMRELQGLTQKELADVSGVSLRSVAGYEGGASVRPNTARKLAKALDVKVADLVGGDARPKGRVLSPRDTEAGTAPREGEVLFEVPCPSGNYEEGMVEALREAKHHHVPEDMRLTFVPGDGKVEVRITPEAASRARRPRRLATRARGGREAAG
jgi:transcriptional regulator with XRE-family HTH domain